MTMNASIDTFVNPAVNQVMDEQTAMQNPTEGLCGMVLKYLCYNLWDTRMEMTQCTAEWSETAQPLVRPPPNEFENESVMTTINENRDLFKIIAPIHIHTFESYLETHPNPLFV